MEMAMKAEAIERAAPMAHRTNDVHRESIIGFGPGHTIP